MAVPGGGVSLPPSPEQKQAIFDRSIAVTLAFWDSLTLAVQNSWGGPDSTEKRDWFAGAISDLLIETPDADVDYLADFLQQVMYDEFEVNLEDGSPEEISTKILGLRKQITEDDFSQVNQMIAIWEDKQARGSNAKIKFVQGQTEDESDDSENSSDECMEMMDEAPSLIPMTRKTPSSTIDDDGFEVVASRRRR